MGIKIKMNGAFCTFSFYINHIFERIATVNRIDFTIKTYLHFIYTYAQMIIIKVCHGNVFWSMWCCKMRNVYQITSVSMLPRRHISMLYLNLKNGFQKVCHHWEFATQLNSSSIN